MLARLRRCSVRVVRLCGRWLCRVGFVAFFATAGLFADEGRGWAVADIPTVIGNLRNWIIGILSGLATLFFTLGGVRYLMAGGDPGEVESAKRSFRAAAIGYGLALLAPVIVTILQGIVGTGRGQ